MTGGAGFIGSHLVERLVADGSYVRILDSVTEQPADNAEPPLATLAWFEAKLHRDRGTVETTGIEDLPDEEEP